MFNSSSSLSYYFIGIFILFIGAFTVKADTLEQQAQLSATPNFCLTDDQFNYCEIDLLLTWNLVNEELVCIISDYQTIPRWCSDDPSVKSVKLTIKTDKDIQFVLVSKNNNHTLAGVKLKITKAASQQVRRRYRNPWSLF
ncbi:DUF3019 domain-containing protein [Shewanella aestuarii]|uniref:DUF3019 domain-containing protein n=1 Tax=Shewanella aestuarii TaxID=1028752 RepID=UPI001FCB6A5C|nr:DUF3019 domain-containing protein [Shewanella aestuarii]